MFGCYLGIFEEFPRDLLVECDEVGVDERVENSLGFSALACTWTC
jgi:hypothetical protein